MKNTKTLDLNVLILAFFGSMDVTVEICIDLNENKNEKTITINYDTMKTKIILFEEKNDKMEKFISTKFKNCNDEIGKKKDN